MTDRASLCKMLEALLNNNLDSNYKCLGEPYNDKDDFYEGMEKVQDSGKYTDIDKEILEGLASFEKD